MSSSTIVFRAPRAARADAQRFACGAARDCGIPNLYPESLAIGIGIDDIVDCRSSR